jgi:hypothetical protein
MKQETLEELAKDFYSDDDEMMLRIAFKRGYTECKEQIHGQDYLQGFIDQFGDGDLGELSPKEWDALAFLKWLKLNNFENFIFRTFNVHY